MPWMRFSRRAWPAPAGESVEMGMILSFRGASKASEPGIQMQARNMCSGMTEELRPQFQHKTGQPQSLAGFWDIGWVHCSDRGGTVNLLSSYYAYSASCSRRAQPRS